MIGESSITHSISNESDLFKSPHLSESRDLSPSPPPGGQVRDNLGGARDDKDDDPVKAKLLRCGVALHRTKDGYAGRANTIGGYFELNRQVCCSSAST